MRTNTKRTRRKPRQNKPQFALTPFPDRLLCKLRYSEQLQLNPAALTTYYQFKINSIYDPNSTGIGGQPLYRDELATLYNRYRVHRCDWRVTISNLNTPANFCVYPHNDSAGAGFEAAQDNTNAKSGVVSAMTTGNGVEVVRGGIDLAKLLGEDLTDDRDQAVMSANPSNIATLTVYAESLDQATNLSSLNVSVLLTYSVELFDRKEVAQS